jgi:hypothetical protein
VAFVFGNVAGIAATMVDCGGKRVLSLLAILFLLRLVVSSQSQLWRERSGDARLQPRLSDIFGTPKCLRGDPSDIPRFFLAYIVLIGTYKIV